MPAFRRVDAQRAGAKALGILVPPGKKTLVILRPRGLEWDLLPAHWAGEAATPPVFCQFAREEAARIARRLHEWLEDNVARGTNPVETFGNPLAQQFQVWIRAQEHVWVLCHRRPGQPYAPLVFASQEEAARAGCRITPFVHPGADANQEYYFNTQNFSHS
jgi:hypothetical protein